ncbi:C40 family peptidase [Pseudomonas multiresinivorans]|uniref:C40 family peptidase n=1 Tax=Pseudomonas multiresinivorans TaxID=95301 RepID=A0A7Z3BK05_9PSED|nr:C40 family peptidase [Pseudomonas multiresinivorans]QJP08192.1 C40 family peptidase [Pseudomonas multiresinivorans]
MLVLQRIVLLAFLASLAACASRTPPAPPPVVRANVAPVYNTQAADDVLIRAIGLVGTPYRWGGNTPDSGFDCSGLIGYVYRDATGLMLPRSTREMITMRAPTVGRESLQSGDLVFFATSGGRGVSHAGIYVGEGRFVHAPRTGGTVRLDSLDSTYWQKAFLEAKRVLAVQSLALHP